MSLKQNIIYLYFKGKHLITSKSQYQYNHGQYLYFADLNLPQAFEVHFSNKQRGESKTQIGSNKLVEIPDEYFWSGALEIYAWIYLHSGNDDGETIYEVKIPLIKRAKPTDEEPLPVQQSAIDKAIAELNNAVDITNENADKTNADKTQVSTIKEEVVTLKEEIDSTANAVNQDAQSARESANASEQSAQNSAESERKALDYSDEAKGYAQSALESKDTASQKAQVATDASTEAKDFRDEAETFKNEAEQAKQNIVDYRNETKGYRDETLNLKNTVQTLKNQVDETAEEIEDISDNVKEDAQIASQSASSASQSANSASQSANSANQSADNANQSANSASQSASQAEEFKNQSATNVTHYPKVVDGYWYVWDASKNEYVNTNVDARGTKGDKGDVGKTGNGIENTVLNPDYTLTITFTDGTSYITPSIRGEKGIKGDVGNGIASTVLNDDYTLTINFTNGTQYTTPPIRGKQGEKGNQGETGDSGVYIGTNEPTDKNVNVWIDTDESVDSFVNDVQINGTSIVENGVANVPIAEINGDAGLVRVWPNGGITTNTSNRLQISTPSDANIKQGYGAYVPIVAQKQHQSVFYGLAKSAGDTTQSQSSNAVGVYTDEAKGKIQTMLGVPSSDDVVSDVQINGTSIVTDGVANVPLAGTDDFGVVKVIGESYGIASSVGRLSVSKANDAQVQSGTNNFKPIVPSNQHSAAFYGLAKASGDETQLQSANPVGVYTDYAKGAIQNMLDVPSNDDVVNDVRINGSSIVENGVANVPIAEWNTLGLVKPNGGSYGISVDADGSLRFAVPTTNAVKAGQTGNRAITVNIQHESTFYGLAKAAGDTTQSQSSNAVGNYTEDAKSAISEMLGGSVSVSGTTPTIVAKSGIRYICGEVATLDFTPSATGICDVVFTSGATATVLTVPNTVRWANGFDPTSLDANTTYEINVMDGLGAVMAWT